MMQLRCGDARESERQINAGRMKGQKAQIEIQNFKEAIGKRCTAVFRRNKAL